MAVNTFNIRNGIHHKNANAVVSQKMVQGESTSIGMYSTSLRLEPQDNRVRDTFVRAMIQKEASILSNLIIITAY